MARNTSKGLTYFNVDCVEQDNLEYVQLVHGIVGYGLVIKLWRRIYQVEGYYCRWDEKTILQFAKKEVGVEIETVNSVVETCLDEGIFDRKMLNDFGILTSNGIQKRWLKIVTDCKRKDREIEAKYNLLPLLPEDNAKTPELIAYTQEESTQRREEERREEKRRKEEIKKERGSSTFVPPTPIDLEDFFLQEEQLSASGWTTKKCKTEAEKFINHYTSVGWKVGRAKIQMHDWQASASKWIETDRKWQEENGPAQSHAAPTRSAAPIGQSQPKEISREPSPAEKKKIARDSIINSYSEFRKQGYFEDYGNSVYLALTVTLPVSEFGVFIKNKDEYYLKKGFERLSARSSGPGDMKSVILKTLEHNSQSNLTDDKKALVEGRKVAVSEFYAHLTANEVKIENILP